jgi:hypothetical protein
LAIESVTAIWQLSVLPSRRQYYRAAPFELSRDAHRVNALLGEACVINNPSLDLALRFDRGQDQFAHFVPNRLVRPSRLTHEMQQRLVFRRDARRPSIVVHV